MFIWILLLLWVIRFQQIWKPWTTFWVGIQSRCTSRSGATLVAYVIKSFPLWRAFLSTSASHQSQLEIRLLFNQKLLIFFLFVRKTICCGYSLEVPHWGTSNEYPQHMFSWRNKKNIFLAWLLIWSYDQSSNTTICFPKINQILKSHTKRLVRN